MKLTEGFNLLATAPDGIKRLRELILSLAVQGKLVPQDANDEPASELLKQIRVEKDRLIAEGRIKKNKPLPAINDDEKPFELPEGWEWSRLDELTELITKGSSPKWQGVEYTQDPSDVVFVTSENVRSFKIDISEPKYVQQKFNEIEPRSILKRGDYLMNIVGASIGRVAIFESDVVANINQAVCLIRFVPKNYIPEFFLSFLNSNICLGYMFDKKVDSARANLSMGNISKFIIPLPPLAEQSRIVAKVEELMALCDALETRGRLEDEQHARLTATLFDALAASESANQLHENWARLASHFDLILDRPEAVDALEQTLLQLAVRGLLIEQDPNDEPASELLKQIRAEKDWLVAEGKIKKDKPLLAISDDEKPFELPHGWEWVRFGSVINSSEAGWSPSCDGAPRAGDFWGVLKVSAVSWGEFRSYENKALPIELMPRSEIEVRAGDFLLSRANTEELVARSVVADNPEPKLMLSDKIIRLDLSSFVNRYFFNQVNNSAYSRTHYMRQASGTSSSMKNVSREVIINLPIPVPPLSEQSRIVARVEALRTLCADLRVRLVRSQNVQTHLAEALVENT